MPQKEREVLGGNRSSLCCRLPQAKVDELALATVQRTLASPATERDLAALFRDVFADKPLQMDVGHALWNATWYSVTPWVLAGLCPVPPSLPPSPAHSLPSCSIMHEVER